MPYQGINTTFPQAMSVGKRCFLLLLLLQILFPGVDSTQQKLIRNKVSKQRLLDKITKNLAENDVECLNYFAQSAGDTFSLSTPVVNIHLDKM